eukprot:gene13917-297_t
MRASSLCAPPFAFQQGLAPLARKPCGQLDPATAPL